MALRAVAVRGRLDLSTLDSDLYCLTHSGLAESMHRTYCAGVKLYLIFTAVFCVSPPPKLVLCYFVFLAKQGPAPDTIKTYLAAMRHTQIILGVTPFAACADTEWPTAEPLLTNYHIHPSEAAGGVATCDCA